MTQPVPVRCFACDAEIALGPEARVGFRDECEACGADAHACRNCTFHDPSAYNECREPNAERVGDRERANRCDYFQAGAGGGGGRRIESERQDARGALDALFKK